MSPRCSQKKPVSRMGPNIKTVLGDPVHWDTLKLPLRGCSSRDPTQLWRCRKHKRVEAACLLEASSSSSTNHRSVVFVDGGAHFGDTTLTLAVHARAHKTNVRFVVLEPCRRKCKFIRTMVRKNGLERVVTIFNACVGDQCRDSLRPTEAHFERYDGRVAYQEVTETNDENDTNNDGRAGEQKRKDLIQRCLYFHINQDDDDDDRTHEEDDDSGSESGSDDDEESNSATAVAMLSLDSISDYIQPLGVLHLDVEGWEARAIDGAKKVLSETKQTCFVIAEVWSERDCQRRRDARSVTGVSGRDDCEQADNSPDEAVVQAMQAHPHFVRLDDIVDQERNLMFKYTPPGGSGRKEENGE